MNSYHFIGIGGAGMSAIAGVLLGMGHKVSGSDIKESRHTESLRKEGAKIFIGHARENILDPDVVVFSSAITKNNIEYDEAFRKKIRVIQRAEMLGEMVLDKSMIAVAGTHGKTTTTSMISTIMLEAGEDPTYLIGAELNEIGANSRYGRGRVCIAEADESDGSLLFLKPEVVVITNVECDHLEYYSDLNAIESIFLKFINENLCKNGTAVICGDEKNLADLSNKFERKVISYGLSSENDIYAGDVHLNEFSSRFKVYKNKTLLGEIFLRVPGMHNVLNALASVCVGITANLGFNQISKGLSSYKGVKRRFEMLGSINGITVVDDYAHHPSEIHATLGAAQNGCWNRVIAVFQPHRFSRTKFLADEFGKCFTGADKIILTDVYGAGEDPIPGITGKLLVNCALKADPGKDIAYLPGKSDIINYLITVLEAGDLVLFMGAGDIFSAGLQLLADLERRSEVKTAINF